MSILIANAFIGDGPFDGRTDARELSTITTFAQIKDELWSFVVANDYAQSLSF